MPDLSWYMNRFRCMSWQEVRSRMYSAVYMNTQRIGMFTARHPPEPDLNQAAAPVLSGTRCVNVDKYRRAAEFILDGKLNLFTLNNLNYGKIPNWNQNAQSGQNVPLRFGKMLDYRNVARVGDIKYIWIPNRHDHLVTVAQAYYLTADPRYLSFISKQIVSWIEQCPYLKGPNWTSSLELAIRLINWANIWSLIGGVDSELFSGEDGKQFRSRWLAVIFQHADFIHGHFSKNSSANNHLIGEAAGLFVACESWPFWKQFNSWRSISQTILEQEMLAQNYRDGVNKEQTFFYQQFVLNFFLIAELAAQANDRPFSREYKKRMECMLEFIASMMDKSGNMPMVGDGDDGYILRLSPEKGFCHYRSLLATGSLLFGRKEFKVKAGELDDKTCWLLGDSVAQTYLSIKNGGAILPVRQEFPEGGYYILGSDFETEKEIRMIVDAGPLGYTSIAAHGHADALAVMLSVSGMEFLVDPGTFSYQSEVKWRDYFRGTSAHNTVRIDQQDQSVIGGKFMWHHKAHADCEQWESDTNKDKFVGYQNGYLRLDDPVLHRREISFDKATKRFHITDSLECKQHHEVELFWHFSERCEVMVDGSSIYAWQDGCMVALDLKDAGWEIRSCFGQESPPCGWVSRYFNVKVPTTTIVCKRNIDGTDSFATKITIWFAK